jgi:hypothetical protein
MNIPLGFEIGTGARVDIPLGHTIVLGQTQLSGKTTTLQAMTERSGVCAIAFITKRGEKSFRAARPIPPYFTETSTMQPYWKFVLSLVESTQQVKLGFRERGWVMDLCRSSEIAVKGEDAKGKKTTQHHKWKKPATLREVLANAQTALDHSKGMNRMICLQLVEYLQMAVPEIEDAGLSDSITLQRGINVMDISKLSIHVQALVIRSVVEWVYTSRKNTVVIIPEAWKFLPEGRDTPVSFPVEELIRQGAVLRNFVWIDLQDLRGIKKLLLRSIQVWLFGVQREKNEVMNTLKSMPTPEHKPSASDMMQLGIGEFIAAYGNELRRVYVWPAGMEETHAQAIALGQEDVKSWKRISRALDEQKKETETDTENLGGPGDDADGGGIPGVLTVRTVETSEENSEDEMWKEKYEALKLDYDALLIRVAGLESLATPSADVRVTGLAGKDSADLAGTADRAAGAVEPRISAPAAPPNGNYDAIYRYIVDRIDKEKPYQTLLNLAVTRPEIIVKREIKKIDMDTSSMKGSLAVLIHEKFFDGAREFADVRKELIRRAMINAKTPNQQLSQSLNTLAEYGFLTKEETGYQAVAGMKVNIVEARA